MPTLAFISHPRPLIIIILIKAASPISTPTLRGLIIITRTQLIGRLVWLMCDQIKAQCQRELWNLYSSDIVYLLGIRLLYCPIFISITFLCIIIVEERWGTNSKRENIRNIIPVTQLCGQGRGTRKAFRLRPDKEMDFSGILTQLEFHRLSWAT